MSELEVRYTVEPEPKPYRYCPDCTYRSPMHGPEYHGPHCPHRETK